MVHVAVVHVRAKQGESRTMQQGLHIGMIGFGAGELRSLAEVPQPAGEQARSAEEHNSGGSWRSTTVQARGVAAAAEVDAGLGTTAGEPHN